LKNGGQNFKPQIKTELMTYFLTHCVEDVDVKTQIYLQEAKSPEKIKMVIEKMDMINSEVQASEMTNIYRKNTYAKVLNEKTDFQQQ